MREESEHERAFSEVNTLARVIAAMVMDHAPISDGLRQEYRDAYTRYRRLRDEDLHPDGSGDID